LRSRSAVLSLLALALTACPSASITPEGEPPGPVEVVASWPANASVDVPVGTALLVVFDRPMDPAAGTSRLDPETAIDRSWIGDGSVLVLTPEEPLLAGTSYRLTVEADHADPEGTILPAAVQITFTTEDGPSASAPQVVATFPADGAADVAVDATLVVVFDQPMDGSGTTSLSPGPALTRSWEGDGAVLVLSPEEPLAQDTAHTLTVGADHTSADGLPLDEEGTVGFTTEAILSVSVDPPHLAVDVDPDTPVSLSWSQPMETTTGTATLTGTRSGSDLPWTRSWDDEGRVATLTPGSSLAGCEDVFLTLGADWTSAAGETWPSQTTTFRTLDQPAPAASPTPADGEADVATWTDLSVDFDAPMDTDVLPTVGWSNHSGGAHLEWVDAGRLELTPEVPFDVLTTVEVTLSGLTDPCGNVAPDVVWGFTTNDCAADCPQPVPLVVNGGKLTGQTAPSGSWALYEVELLEDMIYTVDITNVSGTATAWLTEPQDCGCDPVLWGAIASQPFTLLPGTDVSMEGVVLQPGEAGTYHVVVGPQLLTGDLSFAVEITGDPFQCADPWVWSAPVTQPFAGGVAMDAWELPQPASICTTTDVTVTPTGGDLQLFATSDPAECNPPLLRELGTASAGGPTTVALVQGEHLLVREDGYPAAPGLVSSYELDVGSSTLSACIDATSSHPWVTEESNTPSFGAITWTVEIPAGSISGDTFPPPAIAGSCLVLSGVGRDDVVIAIQTTGLSWLLDVATCSADESTLTWVGTSMGASDVGTDNGSCGGSCPGLFVAGQAEITGAVHGIGSLLFVHVEQGSQPSSDTLWSSDQTITIVSRLF